MTDVVIVGGGPIGLWTAIQLKKRLPAAEVAVYERHLAYQRSHVLRLDHWSMMLYAATSRSAPEKRFVREVTGKSLTGMRTQFAKTLYIRTNDLEAALQQYARDLGVLVHYLRIDSVTHAQELHPECRLFIAADGAHSRLREGLFGADALDSSVLQHVLELKCEERVAVAGGRAPRLAPAKLWKLNRSLDHTASEYVGRVRDGVAPVTLRLFLDAPEYAQLPAMSFKTPHVLGAPGLPAAVERDIQAFLAARRQQGTLAVEGSARLSKLELRMYTARCYASMRGDAAWFLAGDAAIGVPYFRALNSGMMLSSRLAQIIARNIDRPDGGRTRMVTRYNNRYRPAHVATEFAIARGKNWLVDGVHSAREWFAQPEVPAP